MFFIVSVGRERYFLQPLEVVKDMEYEEEEQQVFSKGYFDLSSATRCVQLSNCLFEKIELKLEICTG